MKGWLTGEDLNDWPILILTEEENFLFLIMIGEENTQVLMNIGLSLRFLLFVGTLI